MRVRLWPWRKSLLATIEQSKEQYFWRSNDDAVGAPQRVLNRALCMKRLQPLASQENLRGGLTEAMMAQRTPAGAARAGEFMMSPGNAPLAGRLPKVGGVEGYQFEGVDPHRLVTERNNTQLAQNTALLHHARNRWPSPNFTFCLVTSSNTSSTSTASASKPL